MPTKAILYARFSPRPNADECESVENQLFDLREFCLARKWHVVDEYWDKERSGADQDRPGLIDALHDLKRGYVLVVRDWKRLARDTMYALWIQEQVHGKGATIATLDNGEQFDLNDPMVKLTQTIMHAIAEWDRSMRNRRTSAGMRRNQRQGRRQSLRLPYGMKHDPESPSNEKGVPTLMIEDPAQQGVLADMRRWREEGMSYRQIADRLDTEEVPAPHGDKWHAPSLQRILTRS